MDIGNLVHRIEKIFRANTIEVDVVFGQHDQTRKVKKIEDISELKTDVIELLRNEFKVGTIDKKYIFIGNRKLGATYPISEAIEVAKQWGYNFVVWNGDAIITTEGEDTGLKYSEI